MEIRQACGRNLPAPANAVGTDGPTVIVSSQGDGRLEQIAARPSH
jgi:hypothetical protein